MTLLQTLPAHLLACAIKKVKGQTDMAGIYSFSLGHSPSPCSWIGLPPYSCI